MNYKFYLIALGKAKDDLTNQYLKSISISPKNDIQRNICKNSSVGVAYSDFCVPVNAILNNDALYFSDIEKAKNIYRILISEGYIEAHIVEYVMNTEIHKIKPFD